jgi:putative flippase GtrA
MTPFIATLPQPRATQPPLHRRLRLIAREGWRYGVVSAMALTADTGTYALAYQAGLPLAIAIALGFVIGLAVAYAGSVLWVFGQHRLQDRRAEFAAFAGIGLLGLLLTQACLGWLVSWHHWPAVPAKLLTATGVFGFNFTLRKLLLFSRAPSKNPRS